MTKEEGGKGMKKELQAIYDKWWKIGTTVRPSDKPKVNDALEALYESSGLARPTIHWRPSPLACLEYLAERKAVPLGERVWDKYIVDINGRWLVDEKAQEESATALAGLKPLGAAWRDEPARVLEDECRKHDWPFWPLVWGKDDLWLLAHPEYARLHCGWEPPARACAFLRAWETTVKETSWVFLAEDCAVACEQATEFNIVKNGDQVVLHGDGVPAIGYSDGFRLWRLNGVEVPEHIAVTPGPELDAKLVLEERNAEVRREIVRKMGASLVCERLGAEVIDKSDDGVYELVLLNMGDGRQRPYLKMLNPSIGVWHVEGVGPEVKTVREALKWRNGSELTPQILT